MRMQVKINPHLRFVLNARLYACHKFSSSSSSSYSSSYYFYTLGCKAPKG